MFRRNRAHQTTSRNTSENKNGELHAFGRHMLQSPPAQINRIERKPNQEHKASSLGNKFKSSAFQPQTETMPTKNLLQRQHEYQINNDYYPPTNNQKNTVPNFYSDRSCQKQSNIETFRSSPQLPAYDPEEKKERDSISTELSKQESIELKNNLKEVKFGGVIEEDQHHLFLKKREKVRSPSILKNGRNILNSSIVSASKQRSCSVTSHRRQVQKQKNETNVNQMIKQKYKAVLAKLQANYAGKNSLRNNRFQAATYSTYNSATYNTEKPKINESFKYKDEIFPPVHSSLFSSRKHKPQLGPQIKWMRIGELFSDKELVLAKYHSKIEIYKTEDSYCQDYFPGALNCLLGCPNLLQKMFEEQGVSPFGIYLVKIYQENIWKYIIIDDYIPVIERQKDQWEPAFVNVKSQGDIDIWPFLVQKAYANYYSSYEALNYGNIIDFVEELTGSPSQKIIIRNQSLKKGEKMTSEELESALQRVTKSLKVGNVVAIGELSGEKGFAPITYDLSRGELAWNDPFCEFKKRKLSFDQLKDTFRAVFIISPMKTQNHTFSVLRRSRPALKKKLSSHLREPNHPSLRSFQVIQSGQYSVTLKQRDKRFFHFKDNYGNYIWVRAILLQKEYEDSGYRWISGLYSNKKAINFINFLEAGEYLLLIQPEWQTNSPSELSIHLSGPAICQLNREPFKQQERIMQKGCLDLAQRRGQMNQINKFICSYNYITEKVGLIIQNIVNQRVTGNVSVIRSIRGLKCRSQIIPANGQFYEKITTIDGEQLLKLNDEIQLDIGEGEHYTVVLKMRGGLDSKFFRTFDFGC